MPISPDPKTAREYDGNGWAEIKNNPISKVGVFPYLGKSIDPALEPEKVYMVYRPEEELSNAETIKSFRLVPWIDDHPSRLLGPSETGRVPAEEKGVHGVVGEDIYYEDGTLYANIKIFSDDLADIIESGKKELSVGYGCRYEIYSGIWNGQRYDAIQRSIRGNHLATVAEGRMGPDVAVLDHQMKFSLDAKDLKMADKEKDKDEDNKGPSMDEVMSTLKTLGENYNKMQGVIDKHFGKDDKEDNMSKENCDETEEEKKKREEKEAGDKAAKDAEEKEKEKEAGDKSAQDASHKAVMDSLAEIRKDVAQFKGDYPKQVMREIKQRDQLAEKISGFHGAFDASEMTLNEVAKYGAEKFGLKVAPGQEVVALDAYLLNRAPPAEEATFSLAALDGKEKDATANVVDFYSKAA